MEAASLWKSHGGLQGVYRHWSKCDKLRNDLCRLRPRSPARRQSSRTLVSLRADVTHANVVEKGEFRAAAAR
jgi:S-formylglutathione hydrolase